MQNEDTTKYIIQTKINADGIIERPDIVGAIFGQTEGLLGTDLDLRELQKTGRIGRIEVMVTTKAGKTRGNIFIPSSLDKVKTSVLAASLETIDRVGPCVATIEVIKIEDVRAAKRVNIIERAKTIYKTMFDDELLEAQEITDVIRESVRVEGITTYGKNKLPAGPEYSANEIIVVEGRADVLNLLKYGIKNTISVGGTNVPPEVVELLAGKKVTVFTDGDRGGELIIRELIQLTDVDFVARPPDGKAVEDLVQKEIILALRHRLTRDQYIEKYGIILPSSGKFRKSPAVSESGTERQFLTSKFLEKKTPKRVAKIRQTALLAGSKFAEEPKEEEEESIHSVHKNRDRIKSLEALEKTQPRPEIKKDEDVEDFISVRYVDLDQEPQAEKPVFAHRPEPVFDEERPQKRGRKEREEPEKEKPAIPAPFDKEMNDLTGTLNSKILDENNAVLCEMPVRDLANTLKEGVEGAKTVLFDGAVSQRIIDIAAEKGIKTVIGLRMGNVVKMPSDMKVLTSQV
ncbi:MAG: DNA primase DnaG [Methanimicrococcus sp.]|nr:DNA primase DnaG [Methanimicrococcus sp.]